MATKTGSLGACLLAALLCSCASTSVKSTWKSPDLKAPVGAIAVLCIEERGMLRQAFENRFVTQLRNAGAQAFYTYDLLSLEQIQQDKPAAAERLRTKGASALLILRVVDIAKLNQEVRPADERYVGTISGVETGIWYNYYSVAFMNMSPTYGSLTQKVYLETSLYDLNSAKRLYSALTQTVLKENTDRVAEMDPLVRKIVERMVQDGVIR